MNQILEQLGTYGIVPGCRFTGCSKSRAACRSSLQGRTCLRRGDLPHRCGRRIHPHYERKIPGDAGGSRNCAHNRAGGPRRESRSKIYRQPGLNPEVVKWCQAHEVPVIPGIVTPTEMAQAIGLGLTMVKFFPAEPAGGLKYIRAIAAPYTMMKFMPTGGINPQNVREYLAYDRIAACGGSWMVKNTMIENNEFDRIEGLVKEAVEIVKESRT